MSYKRKKDDCAEERDVVEEMQAFDEIPPLFELVAETQYSVAIPLLFETVSKTQDSDAEREFAYDPEFIQNAGDMVNEMVKLMEINVLNMIALHFRRRLHQYIRFRSAPGKDDDGIPTGKMVKWQIRANCAHFLHKMYDMLAWMEKVLGKHPKTKGARLYSLLPVATAFQAVYVKLNASTLHGLLLPFDKKTFQKNPSEVTRTVFDVKQFETHNCNGCGGKEGEKKKVKTPEEIAEEDTFAKELFKLEPDYSPDVLIGIDPGIRSLVTAVSRLQFFWKHLWFLLAFSVEQAFLRWKFTQNRAKMKALDTLAKRLVPKASKQVCITYGDWSRRTGIKGHASGPVKGFVEALKRRATVIPMDEYPPRK
ncbi:hypothetical protein BBO99_00005155 [Phytophthora kernoviae]|uniref:Uncharacterized protein n=2 Tax=Phytophthora kernoviae TaxID=325452 RepID=A0A3R7GWJ9_9STRA|nr:hypothetical protein G195_005673 [Phytophthora kernoviae 00238/432]RLN37627.1 hypothetical protein BBI17_005288 [Phytophthora kernoviae]RLN79605.1 hypothetical protein BBO99_00005155 [Phytophthora kernoviae]